MTVTKGRPGHTQKDKLTIIRGYDTIMSRVYDFLTLWYLRPLIFDSHRVLLDSAGTGRDRTVLDVGCGTGTMMKIMAEERKIERVVGVDLSTGMLFKARHKLSGEELANKTELLLADAERLPFRSSAFDAVTSSGVVRFLPKAEEAFLEWNVAMKPGGNLAIREMAVTIPRLVRHIPLPFMHSFVVWRLRTDGEMVEMLGRAGYAGVTAFRAGVVPHFIIAMGSPFRRYVFLVASKPSAELDPMSEEAGARTALLKGLPFATT